MPGTRVMTSGHIQVNGARLYYELAGTGAPLVLIHARMLHSGQWDDQFFAFAEHYQVLRYDLRGCGRSTMTYPGSDVDDLHALLDALGLKAVHLIGLAGGAEIALNFALDYPAQVRSLELISPGLDGYEYSDEAIQTWQQFITPVAARDFPAARERYLTLWVDGPVMPAPAELRERVRAMLRLYSFAHYFPPDQEDHTQILERVREADYRTARERLTEIHTPTLIVTGSHDQRDTLHIGELLQRRIQGAKRVMLPAGHLINMHQPEIFNRVILEFLASR